MNERAKSIIHASTIDCERHAGLIKVSLTSSVQLSNASALGVPARLSTLRNHHAIVSPSRKLFLKRDCSFDTCTLHLAQMLTSRANDGTIPSGRVSVTPGGEGSDRLSLDRCISFPYNDCGKEHQRKDLHLSIRVGRHKPFLKMLPATWFFQHQG